MTATVPTSRWGALIVLCAALAPQTVVAGDEDKPDVDVELAPKGLVGGIDPAVLLTARRSVRSVKMTLSAENGRRVVVRHGRIRRGKTARLSIDSPPGRTWYEGKLRVEFKNGHVGLMPLQFAVEVISGLSIEAPGERLDLSKNRLELRLTGKADHCTYKLFLKGGRTQRGAARFAGQAAGTWLPVHWKKPAARVRKIRLICHDKGGRSQGIEVTPVSPPKVVVPKDRVDLDNARAELRMNRPADRCEYELTYDGHPEQRGVAKFEAAEPNTWLPVSWQRRDPEEVVLRIRFKCWDTTGAWATHEVVPWSLEIPHEEVNFETGKSEILADEVPKLDRALEGIETAIRRYGAVLEIRLWVLGYTDTVGDRPSNRALSLSRARAIAAHFRSRGVEIPIRAAGFGEDVLAMQTPDETDAVQNRRARYILGVDAPEKGAWKRVK